MEKRFHQTLQNYYPEAAAEVELGNSAVVPADNLAGIPAVAVDTEADNSEVAAGIPAEELGRRPAEDS